MKKRLMHVNNGTYVRRSQFSDIIKDVQPPHYTHVVVRPFKTPSVPRLGTHANPDVLK